MNGGLSASVARSSARAPVRGVLTVVLGERGGHEGKCRVDLFAPDCEPQAGT